MTPRRRPADVAALLDVLDRARFEFIVIGGVAAIAHGALTPTQDLDVAAAMTHENLQRLMSALAPYHPVHATRPDLGKIPHSIDELTKFRLLLLDTDLGRLDVLSQVEPLGPVDNLEYVELPLVEGRLFRVITLDQLIEVKSFLRRPKDKVVEAELRGLRDGR